ncbi:MAG: class I SAM-dependent DNA methyltransferase [Spirochaetales bacterium]|nr:class I SAM-dependent DNA methyltransferase [Spirochaetales bacterium]
MITGDIKSKIDKLWETFWTGGISNPLTVIEQISYLLFIKRLDDNQLLEEKKAQRLGKPVENPTFPEDKKHLRWSRFRDNEPQVMFDLFQKELFPFLKEELPKSKTSTFARTMSDANFLIPKASLLAQAVDMVEQIPMTDRDTKGDVYEYMLGKISTAGTNGQFRTPRHIIKMMVALMKPTSAMKICDPACGTAGFLAASCEYLIENDPEYRTDMENIFHGFDFDSTMLRIGSMNMMMHGVENPNIKYQDSLSDKNVEAEVYDLVLANPPFKGSLAYDEVASDLLVTVKTKKTELLFLALMLRMLKFGGRAAVIVPDGVLFGSSTAHKNIRKELVENNFLEAVISMPSGVFKPYAGVSTAILVFTKTGSGGTENVWFYDMKNDGFSLDDKRTPVEGSDIPDIIKRFHNQSGEADNKRTEQSFTVPKHEIVDNDYDLSINRYKEIVYEEVEYDEPKVIVERIKELESEIQQGITALEGMI